MLDTNLTALINSVASNPNPNAAEWITAIATVVGCFSLVFLLMQMRQTQKLAKSDHDWNRRQSAMTIIREWDACVTVDSSTHYKLMTMLSPSQVALLANGQAFDVCDPKICSLYPEKKLENGNAKFTDAEAREIRLSIVHLLNSIETVALAYKHSFADKEILNDSFYNLLIEKKLIHKCDGFMDQFGTGSWPTIRQLPSMIKPATPVRPNADAAI